MSFLYPAWFATLIIIPLIVLVVILMRRNRAKIWSAFVSEKHQAELVIQTKPLKFWLSLACSLLGLACIIIAMSRPYAGKSVSREKIQSRNILIAMDTSLSMLCEDVQPNRLDSGVTFAVNLIRSVPDDHIGIMAFAGSPNVITSLSIDHPSIIEELGHLGPGSAHVAGSNLKEALYEGINTLQRAGKQANALILITDGTETLDEIDQITRLAKESYVQIFAIGVGTEAGGKILINGEPHRDTQGKVVHTKLQDKILRQLARDTSGVYTNINTQPEKAIAQAIQSMTKYEQEGREVQIPRELYQWFLAPGILLLMLSALLNARFKSSFPALLTVSFLMLPTNSRADDVSLIDEMTKQYFNRPALEQAGYKALEKKNYPEAIIFLTKAREGTTGNEHAKLSLAIAQAAYRFGDYALATEEYSQALITDQQNIQNISQYNLANTLFKQHTANIKVPKGKDLTKHLEDQIRSGNLENAKLDTMEKGLENAVTHYQDLLKLNPQHTSAQSNKNATESVIKAIQDARETIAQEKKQQQEQQEKENQDKPKKDPDSANKDDKKDGNEEGENDQPNKPKNEDNKGNQDGDNEGNEGDQGKEKNDTNSKNNNGGKNGKNKDNPKNKQDPNSKSDSDSNQQPGEENGDQPEDNAKPQQPNKADAKSDRPAKFNNKKEALELLKKHSDTRKKPLKSGRGYYNRPAIDW